MNDQISPASVSPAGFDEARPTTKSPGAMLRCAREATGIHIAALAVAMKVPVKKLEALEGDRWDLLPDAVFVRALASSMCRALKIDAHPVLEMLPKQDVPKLEAQARGANTPFASSRIRSGQTSSGVRMSPAIWVAVLLLLGAVAVVVWPDSLGWTEASADNAASVQVQAVQPLNPEMAVIDKSPVVDAQMQAVSAPPTALSSMHSQEPQANDGVAASVTESHGAANVVAATPAVSGPANVLIPAVSFHATSPSWVEVTDAKGGVQLRRILTQDERIQVNGLLPLTVVIGRADAVKVEVKGQPFSLASIAKENVARFEVKP
jgi:cytoskeleton protein RodZ